MPKVSIIALIYNLEAYIPLCINSVLDQSFKDFELILINDGSTDNSGCICEEYAKKDERIMVVHKSNDGIAAARNTGIAHATGDYITFIDCDDYFHEQMVEILYKHITSNNADIAMCDYLPTEEGQEEKRKNVILDYSVTTNTHIQALNGLYEKTHTYVVPWNKLYKKGLFKDVKYPSGYLYDDEFTAHRLLYETNKIVYVHAPLYFYVIRNGSTTHSPMTAKKFDKIIALHDRADFFREKNLHNLEEKALLDFTEYFFWYYLQSQIELPQAHDKRAEIKSIYNKLFLRIVRNPLTNKKKKIVFSVFRLSPDIHRLLIKGWRKKPNEVVRR
ncbi:glycosyltransferase family 2 protein [Virgibacillus salinus]|uniref:Glycosyl transferase family 2 n=1 Tax=Virgibacillus salinus TaxID=553311 RepID=A0A1H0Y488_9BACI|nr:glycosyltransferase [Virgibacillus salinus]SDQ09766.1 Glycosyl transferase family 2 [Virgibacillus salinus]